MMLPPVRVALRLPAVRMAAVLVVAAPLIVRWLGEADQRPVRLRLVGVLLAAGAAMVWDDRCAVLTSPTPVGLPAVRRGRALLVLALLLLAWGLSCLAATGHHVPWKVVSVQTGVLAVLIVGLVGWFGRDREGDQLLTLPMPVTLLTVALVSRLPQRFSLLAEQPGRDGWLRWCLLLVLSLALVLRLDRDPAARRTLRP